MLYCLYNNNTGILEKYESYNFMTEEKQTNSIFLKTLSDYEKPRKSFKIYQANILAQSFGNLEGTEVTLLGYCLTLIKKHDDPNLEYRIKASSVLSGLELSDGGKNYKLVRDTFKKLEKKTSIIIPTNKKLDGQIIKGYVSAPIFKSVFYGENDTDFTFIFNDLVTPYLFELNGLFFEVDFFDVIKLKNKKYALLLLSLYSKAIFKNNRRAKIEGSVDEWRLWLLGTEFCENEEKLANWTPGRFRSNVLRYGLEQLKKVLGFTYTIRNIRKGKETVGFVVQMYRPSANSMYLSEQDKQEVLGSPEQDKLIIDTVFQYAIETDTSPKMAAKELWDKKIIEYIPISLL